MAEIPEKLKKRGIYFVLIKPRDKKPFQMGWQNKIIEFDNWELEEHLKNGGNYGVMGGGEKNLILVDFDNSFVQNLAIKDLPETLTVKTGSNMLHLYFFTNPNPESFKGFDEEMNTLFDVQGKNKQVVGPSSIHPNGNKYELIKDVPIAFIDYAELKAKLMAFDRKPKKNLVKVNEEGNKKEYIKIAGDDLLDNIKRRVNMSQALQYCGTDTSKNPTACPMHSSKGGKCLGYNNLTAHCFHCEGSWNVFSLIKDYKRCDFKEALDILAGLAGMKDQLIESKVKYVEKMKKLEAELLQKKLDEEKAKIAVRHKTHITIPGKDKTTKTIEGEVLDPAAAAIIRRELRLKPTRGTTLAPEPDANVHKINIPEEKKEEKKDDTTEDKTN